MIYTGYPPSNYLLAASPYLCVLLMLPVTQHQQKEVPPWQLPIYGKAFHEMLIYLSVNFKKNLFQLFNAKWYMYR